MIAAAPAIVLVLAHAVQAAEKAQASSPAPVSMLSATNLSLDETVKTALRDNSELKRLRAKWEAMRERPAQASALPNPMLRYSAMGLKDDFRFPDSEENRIGVEQEFPWFGKRALRGQIAEKDAAAMEREY